MFSRYDQDLVTFRERTPTKKELQLMPEYVLPSGLNVGISTGKLDIKEYKREMKKYVNFITFGYELKNFERSPDIISIERANPVIGQYLRLIREYLTVDLQKKMNEGEIKPGFYMSLRIHCTFRKDNEKINMWLSSLTHRRDEVYVSTRGDIYKVLGLLLEEIRIRLIGVEGS